MIQAFVVPHVHTKCCTLIAHICRTILAPQPSFECEALKRELGYKGLIIGDLDARVTRLITEKHQIMTSAAAAAAEAAKTAAVAAAASLRHRCTLCQATSSGPNCKPARKVSESSLVGTNNPYFDPVNTPAASTTEVSSCESCVSLALGEM